MRGAAFSTRGDFQCAMRLPMLEETFNARCGFQCSKRLSMRDATSNARRDFQCAMRLPMLGETFNARCDFQCAMRLYDRDGLRRSRRRRCTHGTESTYRDLVTRITLRITNDDFVCQSGQDSLNKFSNDAKRLLPKQMTETPTPPQNQKLQAEIAIKPSYLFHRSYKAFHISFD